MPLFISIRACFFTRAGSREETGTYRDKKGHKKSFSHRSNSIEVGEFMRIILVFSLLLGIQLPLEAQNEWTINLRNTDLREFITQVSEIS